MDIHGTVSLKNENRYKSLKYVSDDLELLAFAYNYINFHSFNFEHPHLVNTKFYWIQNEEK